MDIRQCLTDFLIVILLLCIHRGLSNMDDDYEDGPPAGRCPWIRNKLKNGRVRYRYKGRVAKFLCDSGYELAGKRSTTCVRGQWTNPVPVCVARGCSRVPFIPNGRVTEMYRGALLVYDCNPGYTLDGETSIHCDGRRWSTAPPACVIANENPETFCDFESPDLCGWSHDPHHDFDWKRNQFSTPSGHVGTGPSFDHTFGENKGGFYLYIEASSPRKINDTARLFSPVYPAHLSGGCFLFWYHMYGATTGGLRVYLKPESHVFDELRPTWEKYGDQGNQWLRGNIIVPVVHENFQIVIEGVRGESYVGDSAIDDVRLTTSLCDDSENATEITENIAQDSCRGRCREADLDSSCSCNDKCITALNCCSDFLRICGTANDTSGQNTDETSPGDYFGKTSSPITATAALTTVKNEEQTVIITENSTELTSSTRVESTSVVSSGTIPITVSSTSAASTTNTPSIAASNKLSTFITSTTEPSTTAKNTTVATVIVPTSKSKQDNSAASSQSTKSTKYISTTVSPVITTSTSVSATSLKTTISSTISKKTAPSTTSLKTTALTTSVKMTPSTILFTKITTQASTLPTTATISSKDPVQSTVSSSPETTMSNTSSITTATLQSAARSTTTPTSTVFPTSYVTTVSPTRKTYNLRPRTLRTTPVSSTTSSTMSTTKQYIFTSNIPIKEDTSTFSEVKSSIPYSTTWHKFTFSLSTTTSSTGSTTTSSTTKTSTVPTRKVITTKRHYILPNTNPEYLPQTTVRNIPQTSTQNIPKTTKFPSRSTKSTSLPTASKTETTASNSSVPIVISIVVILIMCVIVGLVYYMRKRRSKRQSKLSDDSEMRFLPESEYMEYADASALDKIFTK